MASVKNIIKAVVPYSVLSSIRDCIRFVSALKYIGNKYYCPFCNGRFSTFLPLGHKSPVFTEKKIVGGGYRLNARCPRCYSSDRERLIYLYLDLGKKYIFSESIKLLHVAPEKNLAIKLKSQSNIHYISADLNSPSADIKMDITDIKQRDETYDVIICNHVLEHIHDDSNAIRELFRILKKGGFAILQVPISYSIEKTFEDSSITNPDDRELVFGQKDHVRIYGNDYKLRLEAEGFSVTAHNFVENLEPKDVVKFGLLEEEKIFVCSKP